MTLKAMTLKEELMQKFNLRDDQFSNHYSDLYILPDDWEQASALLDFIRDDGWSCVNVSHAGVEGHDWYGKLFIDVAFGYGEYFKGK